MSPRPAPQKRNKSDRRGAALIELAICLPVFFLITMATIETCRMVYLRQSLKLAAYECARLGVTPGMTRDAMQTQCDAIMLGRNLRGYQFDCSPADPSQLKYGELLVTTVQISAKDNALVGSWFYKNKVFKESVTIMGEY